MESIEDSTEGTYYVSIGTDSTFYTSDLGDATTIRLWGLPIGSWGADYVLPENKDRGAVLLFPSFGGVSVAAWIGPKVVVTGSGTATAKFFVNGRLLGYLWYAATWWGVASSYVRVGIGYKDLTTGQGAATFILTYTIPWYYDVEINAWFPTAIEIEAGHTYVFFLLLEAGADVYGGGGAVADFGPQDGDYAGEGLWFNYILLDFQ